jgi:hypothetical protein
MTRDFYPFEPAFLGRVATRIINEVRGINRVVYGYTSKAAGDDRMGVGEGPSFQTHDLPPVVLSSLLAYRFAEAKRRDRDVATTVAHSAH